MVMTSDKEGPASKRRNLAMAESSPPPKRAKLLMDDEDPASDSSTSSKVGGVSISKSSDLSTNNGFTVNHEFAQRFEHNKKREELHRCMVTSIQFAHVLF